jgi:Flp pilus assembly protein TadD
MREVFLPSMKERYYIGLLLAAVVLVYSNTLWNAFTMDDDLYITTNPQVTSPTARALFTPHKPSNLFRPVTFATFAANWASSGGRPFVFHFVNLLLHSAVTCLLYFVLQNLLAWWPRGKDAAFVATLLFGVHPIHTEAVSSIAGRSELLAAGFVLAAWLLHLQDREIGALLCFVLALLSKESAVAFLPLVLVGDYVRGKFKSISCYIRAGGMTVLYLALLWKIQGGHFGIGVVSHLDNPLATIPAPWRILNAFHVAWKYVGLQFYPATLSCDYSFNQIPVYLDLRHTLSWAIAALAVLGGWIWAFKERHSGLVLAGGIYLAGFAATANILTPTGTIMGERLAYLPSAGFCLLIALAFMWLQNRSRRLQFAVLIIVIAALGVRTVVRNRDWKDNLTLYSAGVRAAPRSAKMHSDLGMEYVNAGQTDAARQEFQTALQIEPVFPDAMEAYGMLEAKAGDYQKGGHMLEEAYYLSGPNNPNYDYMAVNLAAVLMQTDHLDGALDILNRRIAESPAYARAWSNRAVIRYKRGEAALARTDAETALRLDPSNKLARNVIGLLDAPSSSAPAQ